jgi:hypothetical protein
LPAKLELAPRPAPAPDGIGLPPDPARALSPAWAALPPAGRELWSLIEHPKSTAETKNEAAAAQGTR